MPRHDYHTHSNYSDGDFLWRMVRAADELGLDGIGIADHCTVSTDPRRRIEANRNGFVLDVTYERRREAIEALRNDDRFDVAIYDAVELDYHPDDEAAIADFLERAGFDYAIGSVHHLDGANVHLASHFADQSRERRRALVEEYVDRLVALIDSELFDVAAHLDLVERTPPLRGLLEEEHYRRVADALAASRTVPELNAGRVLADYGELHPRPTFLDVLLEHDVDVVVGSDAHFADELRERTPVLADAFDERGIEPARLPLG